MNQTDYIDSFAEVKSQFDSVSNTPWSRLAATIPENATVDETLTLAGLDWTVDKLPLQTTTTTGDIITVPDSFCLLRRDTNELLSRYMGKSYKPVQNKRAFEIFDQFVNAGNMTMETAGSLLGGKYVWGLAHINNEFTIGNGEKIRGYFLLMQSHAYGNSLKALFTAIRFPGGHSVVHPLRGVGGSTGIYSMPHSKVFDNERIEEIKDILTMANDCMHTLEQKAKFLANTEFTTKDNIFYLATVFDRKLIANRKGTKIGLPTTEEELLQSEDVSRTLKKIWEMQHQYDGADLDSCKGTAWGAYNTVLYAIDHEIGRSEDTRLKSAWLGNGAGIKMQALDIALALGAAK